jgi:hypothetical protein
LQALDAVRCEAPMCPLEGLPQVASQLRHCARCMAVRYCSEACQARAWRAGHKRECAQLAAAAAAQDDGDDDDA